jgi:hypothetical protein
VRWRNKGLPVARKEGLLVEPVGDETVVYDAKTKEAHCLSPLTAAVFAHCDGDTTIDELTALTAESLGEPVEPSRVLDALAQLEERDLMAVPVKTGDDLSRRDMLRRSAAAAGGVAMAPLITSVVAPNAIAANSATCANLLCCPCCTITGLNKQECCTITNVTRNCQCVNGSRTLKYGPGVGPLQPNNCAKYCKPSGAAPSDAACAAMFASDAAAKTACNANGAYSFGKSFEQCLACAGCPT